MAGAEGHGRERMVKVLEELVAGRRSVRAFTPQPVAKAVIAAILDLARRAPSGTNIQPWKVYVLTGGAKRRLSTAILDAIRRGEEHQDEYRYYPDAWQEPYRSRRRKLGQDLYELLGIARGDKAGMAAQHERNYLFFDAPVGLIFTIDRQLAPGSWIDYGMFLQTVMLAARAHGLDTCPQQSFVKFHKVVRPAVGAPESELVLCGMSLGFADEAAMVNRLRSEREPVEGFACFLD